MYVCGHMLLSLSDVKDEAEAHARETGKSAGENSTIKLSFLLAHIQMCTINKHNSTWQDARMIRFSLSLRKRPQLQESESDQQATSNMQVKICTQNSSAES
jgi:hypothetical protein